MNDDLISGTGLLAALSGPTPPAVLDVRWTIAGGADRQAYLDGHIPGAVFLDLDTDLAAPPGPSGRHPLPGPADLQASWRRAGLDDTTEIVVYDNADSSGAVRAWWLLRWSGATQVRVLDGGLGQWPGALAHGGTAPARPGSFTVRPGGLPTVDADAASNLAVEPWGALLDARAAPRYRGEVEPIDPVAGHIPGAVNLPYSRLYQPDGTLRPAGELREVFRAAGVVDGEPVAASCGSGITACHLVLAGRVAGFELALYPGSFSEWCALGRPIETGAQ